MLGGTRMWNCRVKLTSPWNLEARSRLYQSRFLQPNIHRAAFFEIFKIYRLLHRSTFKISRFFFQNFAKFKFRWILFSIFENFYKILLNLAENLAINLDLQVLWRGAVESKLKQLRGDVPAAARPTNRKTRPAHNSRKAANFRKFLAAPLSAKYRKSMPVGHDFEDFSKTRELSVDFENPMVDHRTSSQR